MDVGARPKRHAGADWLECSVRDTGTGIPSEAVARLFSAFERGPNSQRAGGTGLGLAISKAIIELHRGSIGVDSSPGKGSRFFFQVPIGP